MRNSGAPEQLYLLAFYVPVEAAEAVKDALFLAGAGRYKHYDRCAWETLGRGQFRPLKGSNPHKGSQEQISRIPELKVELVCSSDSVDQVLAALFAQHPYEEPAYHLLPFLTAKSATNAK